MLDITRHDVTVQTPNLLIYRPRPTRDDMLAFIGRGRTLPDNHKQCLKSICQTDCSHCWAGHCGTS